ncbi:MAG: peptide deformylase [Opitutaceae bacterium]
MAQLEIVHYGNPILRKKGEPVVSFDQALSKLGADMVETMHSAEGIGLAAQQVGLALQFCVVDLRGGDWTFDFELNGSVNPPLDLIMPLYVANPMVTARTEPVTTASEGCLSFPEIHGDIDRPDFIEVRYKDLEGRDNLLTCNGMLSRCIQHEVDHLNGVLFIDRMHRSSLAEIDQAVKRLKKQTRKNLRKAN